MMEKIIENLINRSPLAVIIIGVTVFLIGAVGEVPVGNPPLRVPDVGWRIALGAMGAILVVSGILLLVGEVRAWPKTRKRKARAVGANKTKPVDSRLSLLIPPFDPGHFVTVRFPERSGASVFNWPYTPIGVIVVYDTPFFVEPVFGSDLRYLGHRTIDIHPQPENKPNVESQ